MSLAHPLARARGLGSAKNGTQHWWVQRLTAVALALLSPWFIWMAVTLAGADVAVVRAALAQPVNAVLMLAFIVSLFWHARLGLQVVIEDYIHTHWLEVTLQIVVLFAYILAALASAIALGRIVFTG
jgi:succinate dehydrogenase / fumarate reductase membrane anchor subunit